MKKFYTEGVCAAEIDFEIEDGILVDVKFEGGCEGNLKAVSTLIKGMKVEDVIQKLKGAPFPGIPFPSRCKKDTGTA